MAKPGPPKTKIDYKLVEKLAHIQCTVEEIAAVLDLDQSTVYRRLKSDPKMAKAFEKGRESGKISLRRAQFHVATQNHNVSMLIWLGKQYLGQRDQVETKAYTEHEHKLNVKNLTTEELRTLEQIIKKADGELGDDAGSAAAVHAGKEAGKEAGTARLPQ